MKRRYILYAAVTAAVGLLYFFENGTATRAVFAAAIVLPLIPMSGRALFSPDAPGAPSKEDAPVVVESQRPSREVCGARPYVPGDPIRLIHWKLSAKRDELLVRETESGTTRETAVIKRPVDRTGKRRAPIGKAQYCLIAAAVLLIMTLILPEARRGAMRLMNILFEQSEAVNAYAYARLDVAQDQSTILARVLISGAVISLAAAAALSKSRVPAAVEMTALCLGQAYFGLTLPGYVNAALFMLFALAMAGRPLTLKRAARLIAPPIAAMLIVCILLPGAHAGLESASESVRDALGRAAPPISGAYDLSAQGGIETRHVHTRTLISGEGYTRLDRAFRLVTLERQRVSLPHFINYFRIAAMLVLVVVVVIAPFLPFLYLNARKNAAFKRRALFFSPDAREAVTAIFRHVMLWRCAAGGDVFPEDYLRLYDQCAADYEEAFYSRHPILETQRERALKLLEDTERLIKPRCSVRQRLKLKYGVCLWL